MKLFSSFRLFLSNLTVLTLLLGSSQLFAAGEPTLTLTAPSVVNTAFTLDMTFSEDVTGFVDGELIAINATVAGFSGSGSAYSATITPQSYGSDIFLIVPSGVAMDIDSNENLSATLVVKTNHLGSVSISGDAVVGSTLSADVSDEDGTSNASFSYQWYSDGAPVGLDVASYLVLITDLGNTISVDVSYNDDLGFAEDISSSPSSVVVSVEQNALNIISSYANHAVAPAPTLSNYTNAGVSDVSFQILALVNIAVANAASSTDVDSAVEIQALVDTVLEGQDNDNDGIPNFLEGDDATDADGDGIANRDDEDSDGDGILDINENDLVLVDIDTDGIADIFDADVGNDGVVDVDKTADANFDGVDDAFATLADVDIDADSDGLPNFLDLDSDNDAVLDTREVGAVDNNRDGLLDIDEELVELPLSDQNDDMLPDFLDVMSDGVSFDIVRAGLQNFDLDDDGIIDSTIDMDNDGIMDVVDNAVGAFGSLRDMDGDGIPNHEDDDDDNDGILDVDENSQAAFFTGLDADADGIDDGVDVEINGTVYGADADGNGVLDSRELDDLDGDGIADHLDFDSDNDGVGDRYDISINVENDVMKAEQGFGLINIYFVLILSLGFVLRVSGKYVALLFLLLFSNAAFAEENTQKWNIGMGMSAIKYQAELVPGLTLTDSTGLGGGISVGRYFNDNFQLQLRYDDLGRAEVNYIATISYEDIALNANYIFSHWKFQGMVPYITGGLHHLKAESTGGLTLEEQDNVDPLFGIGARYAFNNGYLASEFTSYNQDLYAISLSINTLF